jgi:hypothetical protein
MHFELCSYCGCYGVKQKGITQHSALYRILLTLDTTILFKLSPKFGVGLSTKNLASVIISLLFHRRYTNLTWLGLKGYNPLLLHNISCANLYATVLE